MSNRLPALPDAGAHGSNGGLASDRGSPPGSVESTAQYQVFPTTFGLREGTLSLEGGRLSFTRPDGEVIFDAAIGEFHSFRTTAMDAGFHLWQGPRRHRILFQRHFGTAARPGIVGAAEDLQKGLADIAQGESETKRWQEVLVPLIAPAPPPGVRVKTPPRGWRYGLRTGGAVAGLTALIVAVVVAFVFLTS